MKTKKEQKRMTAKEFDIEPSFQKKLAETQEIFRERELKDCFGYYATRDINQGSTHTEVVENATLLSACYKCDPHVRDVCFQASLMRTIATVFKD